jgi:putative ABC transport system permease protein
VRVGETILLRDTPYQVVGIVDVGGGAMETEIADQDIALGEKTVFVPLATPPYWLGLGRRVDRLDAVFVKVSDAARYDRVLEASQLLLSQPDYTSLGLSWVTPQLLLVRVRRLQSTIKLTVGSIAVLCLILGGTTLMSLMVANVRERVTEIGLRRTLGATRRDIAILFIVEACAVTATAATAAVAATHLVLGIARTRLPVPVAFGASTILLPVIVAVGLGITFSYWPSRAASSIVPSEALRNE